MGKQIYYVMELHGPHGVTIIYSKSYAIECLEHNREFTDYEYRLYKVWKDRKGNELKRKEIMPY